MTILIVIAAFSYTLAGALLWHTIVLRDVSPMDQAKCRFGEEIEALHENQTMMQENERAGDIAHLFCKALFVTAWPAIILYGVITARLLDM